MLAERKPLTDVIVGTSISKSDSLKGRFLFVLFKNAQKMFMAVANLPNDHANTFSIRDRVECPEADTTSIFHSLSFGNWIG